MVPHHSLESESKLAQGRKVSLMNSFAPAETAVTEENSLSCPVITIMGKLGMRFKSSLVRVIPSILGITMSAMTASNLLARAFSRASTPSTAWKHDGLFGIRGPQRDSSSPPHRPRRERYTLKFLKRFLQISCSTCPGHSKNGA